MVSNNRLWSQNVTIDSTKSIITSVDVANDKKLNFSYLMLGLIDDPDSKYFIRFVCNLSDNNPDFVDLGLSVKWYKYNCGAFVTLDKGVEYDYQTILDIINSNE